MQTRIGLGLLLLALGSLWFAAVLLVLVLVAMACATVVEAARGTEQALATFYYSWWFGALLCLLALNVLAALLLRIPFSGRQTGFVLVHASILLTFAGALVTKYRATSGQVGITEGQTVSHFGVARDMLTLEQSGQQNRSILDLSDTVAGRFRPSDLSEAPVLSLGELRAEVVRYLPDSEWRQQVSDDSPDARTAIEVVFAHAASRDPVWLLAGQTTLIGGVHVSYRQAEDRAELERLVNCAPASQPVSKGMVRIEYGGGTHEFPVEAGMDAPVLLGETGYTARVVRYLPHATVGSDKRVVNASNRPVNPYIEVELTGPEGSETRRAFAKFPEFESTHGPGRIVGLRLAFVAGSDDLPTAPVEVLSGPQGELYVRFTRAGFKTVTRALAVGTAVESPWPKRELAVLSYYEHARMGWTLEPVEPVRDTRTPAILVRLSEHAHTSETWLQKHSRVPVSVADLAYELSYVDKSEPLGFSVTLERFRVGYYPGSRRPRSFESQITVTDPSSGRSQSRVVSMNRPARFGGYNLYQSSYRSERGQTISYLSVSRDPGQPIVFAGYIGLIAGLLVVFGTRLAERRHRTGALAADAAGTGVSAQPRPQD
ncbi:MAG: cytochrome c biogenesis protein ResB [Planctomycetes bacterium]|nr:cytochrome c biogenesis protein ResB [Planctomycetota bacterium]